MDIAHLSRVFSVRKLGTADIGVVYRLSCGNPVFYRYHPPFVTAESIAGDLTALPPGKTPADKFYVGFFDRTELIAVMDLILGYPAADTAFIGLLMLDIAQQGKGVGSQIVRDCAAYLKTLSYRKIRLGADKDNPQSNAFWRKNGFSPVGETAQYRIFERQL